MYNGWKIILFAFTVRLLFLLAIPLEENTIPFTLSAYNDEQAHFNYIRYIAIHHSRPVQTSSVEDYSINGINEFEYYQSPLYYTIAGYFYNLTPEGEGSILLQRILNMIFGLLTILTIGQCLYLLSPKYSAGGMLFLSVLPSIMMFSVTVTNDALFGLFSSLFAYFALESLRNPRVLPALGLAISFSAAVWTKMSGLVLFPALVYVLYMAMGRYGLAKRIVLAAGSSLLSILSIAPLLMENYALYGQIIPMSVGGGSGYSLWEGLSPLSLLQTGNFILHSFYFPFYNFWTGAAQIIIFIGLGVISIVIAFNAVRYFLNILKRDTTWRYDTAVFFIITLAFSAGGLFWMSLRYHQSEARLAFMALPAITYFYLSGLEKTLERHPRFFMRAVFFIPVIPYVLFLIE